MGIAVFNYATWAASYPELATSVDAAAAQRYFDTAGFLLTNTDCSVVQDVGRRLVLLNMLTAHLAKLFATINGAAPSGLVGAVKSATEGSVSVATGLGEMSGSEAFYAQTPYGFLFWQATRKYRSATYVPGPCPSPGPFVGAPGTEYFGGNWGGFARPWQY